MAILTHNVKSSDHLKSFAYDDHAKVMMVTFEHERSNGTQVYRHKNVPKETFNAWLKWSKDGHSPGAYYHRYLKNYPRITE